MIDEKITISFQILCQTGQNQTHFGMSVFNSGISSVFEYYSDFCIKCNVF